jgi:hypothetical protein
MNKEEKRAIEKFRKLGIKKFREEKLTNEDLPSYFEFVIILNLIEKLQKENEELKIVKSAIQTLQINSMEDEKYIVISKSSFFDGSYKHLLDEFIPIQKVKDRIEKYKKLSDKFYVKFLESDRYNTDIREKGIKCDAIILALEELIEEREEK